MDYVKIIDGQLVSPTDAEFHGIPNWRLNDAVLRSSGYLPLEGVPDAPDGHVAVHDAFRVEKRTSSVAVKIPEVVVERDPETGEETGCHTEFIDAVQEVDASVVVVTSCHFEPIPPPPLPTVFSKGEVLEALKALGYYDVAYSIYDSAAGGKLRLYWATYSEIDLNFPATLEVISENQDFLAPEYIQALISWIVDERAGKHKQGE